MVHVRHILLFCCSTILRIARINSYIKLFILYIRYLYHEIMHLKNRNTISVGTDSKLILLYSTPVSLLTRASRQIKHHGRS